MVKSIALMLALVASPAAHPLHSSYTEIARDERSGTLTVSVRLFADDFGAMLDSLRGTSAFRTLTPEQVARAYFNRSFSLSTGTTAVQLEWDGMTTVGGLTLIRVRSVGPVKDRLQIRNALMFDRFSDQVSIVRWTGTRGARTIVLSARAPEAVVD